MNKNFSAIRVVIYILMFSVNGAFAQEKYYTVTADDAMNGSFEVDPPIPADGKVKAGAVLTITASPDAAYALDAVYYSIQGMWGTMYYESMSSPFEVVIDQDKHIGASFIETSETDHVNVIQNVVYARPGKKTLKYDVYTPIGAENLPVIVIIHGGGWISNTEDIMRGMARELTRSGNFVVCSIDYRWAHKMDGDVTNNTMADLIGDVYGAIAHIMEHADEYGGDASRILLTGDSAGGHLSAACADMPDNVGSMGFGRTPGVFEFMPSYMPEGKSLEQLSKEMMAAIKAAAPSYGVFGGQMLSHYSEDPAADSTWISAISPLDNIPDAAERKVPKYLTRGTEDPLIRDEMVTDYVDALVKAGQRVQYVQVGGAGHAFFDWKPDERTKAIFRKYGVYYCREMEAFFTSVLNDPE